MAELEAEYRPFSVHFLAVLLGSEKAPEGFPIPTFVLEGESLEALERFGVSEAPAVLTLSPDGRLQYRLEPNASGGVIDPGDIVDAIEAVAFQ
jgi:hypothetical protein